MADISQERQQLQNKLLERAAADDALRLRLKANPRDTVEQELGVKVPAHLTVKVIEEDINTVYLVIPADHAPATAAGGELSDDQLDAVAGGGSQRTYNTSMCCLATIY